MGRKEKANFTRICQLLIDKGGDALRRVLQSKIDTSPPPSTLDSFLKTNIKFLQKIRYRVISTAQWKLLFPAAGSADSNNFDITLLTILLRNICGLASPASGWDVMPPAGDNCSSAEILRIKMFRNEVYAHTTIAQYDDTTFETLWQAISEPLINLKIPKRDIDELKEAALSPEEESYIEALKEWKTLENSLISKLDDMENNLSSKLDDLAREFANKLRGEMSPNTVIQESSRGNAAVEVTSRAVQTDPELTRPGGNILFNIAIDNMQVPRELGRFGIGLVREFCHSDFQLGAIWTVCHLVRPLLRAATRSGFKRKRDGQDDQHDQDTGEPSVGSLHVLVRCFTDERFLEVLADYESGEVKRRLQKELTDVGLKVEGLRVEIENLEEVSRKKTSIIKKSYVNAMASLNLKEKANFTRLSRLLVDKGTEALRNTFNSIHPHASLSAVLNANKKYLLRLKFKVINDHRWDLLFPASGNPPDSKTFDVTLLTVLLRSISGLPPPATGWNAMPPDSDRSTQANITRIKQLRDKVYAHAVSAQVDNAAFEKLWKDVSQALHELKIPQKEIDDLKTCSLGPEEEIYVQRLKEWFQREEDLKSMLDDMRSDVKTMRQEIQDERDGKVEVDLLQKLAKHNFSSKIQRNVKMFHSGTRDWLLQEVGKWFTDEDSSTLMLIRAGPGFGKSVFAAKVCKIFEERKKLAAYHFCDFNNSNLKDPMQMLQSLARHMCDNVPGFRKNLLDELKGPYQVNDLNDAIHVYLQNPLDNLEEEPRLIVIDGLDESATEMLKVIANYFPYLPKCVKVLVTSRPELSLQSLRHAETIEIKATDEKNCSDLLEYLKVCLPEFVVGDAEGLSTTQRHDMDVPNIAVLPVIVEMCEGSFVYAYHIQQELRKRKNYHTMTYDEIMRFLPKGLDSVYRSYFNRLERELEGLLQRKPDLYKLLELLVAAEESLPLGFIAQALDLDLDCREKKRVISEVNEAVSCLLYVSDDLVTVFHKSVRDWLLANGYDDHEYTVKVSDGQRSMWLICEQIFKELKKDASSWLPRNLTSGVRHALEYGFRYLLGTCLTDNGMIDSSSFWFVDMIVIHYITVTVVHPTGFFSINNTWEGVLELGSDPDLKFSQNLRERISWHYLLADEETGRITDYLENVLYRSPEGLFTYDEKTIATELIAKAHRPPMPVLTTVSNYSPLVKKFEDWEEITAIGVSSNKKLVAVALKGVIHILSLPDLCELWQYSTKYDVIPCCTFAPDDSFILFGRLETVLDVQEKAETPYFPETERFITCAFSPSGNRLVTVKNRCGSASPPNLVLDPEYQRSDTVNICFVKLWDVITHCSLMVFRIDVHVDVCCFSTTGLFIIVYCSGNDAYCVWNSITLQRVDQRKLPVSSFNDKRGKRRSERCDRCVCGQSKDLIPYETLDDDLQIVVIYYGIYNGMECVFHLYEQVIRVIERTHFTSVSSWDKFLFRSLIRGAAMLTFITSGDEYFLLSCLNGLFLFKFKRVSTMEVQSSPSPRTRVIWCAFSPDSTRLATCTSDGLVNIWNVDTCHVYQRFKDNIGTVEVACCWLSAYLFVCHISDGILSLSKYPVDANVKVLFTQRHVVYICVVLSSLLTSTILDFSEGYLYFKHGSYAVKFLDVRMPEQGCSLLNLPRYKPGMKIKVLNDSFLSGTDDESIFLWKRNEGHPAIYEVVSEVRHLADWNPVYCFSDDLKYLGVSTFEFPQKSFTVVDVDGRGSKTVQKNDWWIKAWFVDKVVIALTNEKGLGIFDLSTGEYRTVTYHFMLDDDSAQASKLSPRKNLLAVPDVFGDVLFFQLRSVKEYSKSTQSKDRH